MQRDEMRLIHRIFRSLQPVAKVLARSNMPFTILS
jgi:hypothetical protein